MRGNPTPLRAALAGIAAAAALTACGGGSSTTSASGSSASSAPATSSSTSSSPASTSASGGAASGSDFCTQARAFATQAGSALAGGVSSPDAGAQLQALANQLQGITPPPAIASDWQSAVSSLQQFAQAYQGVNLQDPQQLGQLQQRIAPLVQQLTTSGEKVDQYLQTQCGVSVGGTSESASPSS